MCSGHSARSLSAPVREPSPPQTTSASMPWRMRLRAAVRRPSISRKAAQRAVPIKVPPIEANPRTSSQPTCASTLPLVLITRALPRRKETYADDVPSPEGLLSLALLEELSLSVSRDETSALRLVRGSVRARDATGERRRVQWRLADAVLACRFLVSADETLPTFSDDVSFAATARDDSKVSVHSRIRAGSLRSRNSAPCAYDARPLELPD